MAASMNAARIALHFKEIEQENSWFLVNYSTHTKIRDVTNDIQSQYFQSLSSDVVVSLRLNNFRLPSWESSYLLRDNDVVTVRVEHGQTPEKDSCIMNSLENGGQSINSSPKVSTALADRLGRKKRKHHRSESENEAETRKKSKMNSNDVEVSQNLSSSEVLDKLVICSNGTDKILNTSKERKAKRDRAGHMNKEDSKNDGCESIELFKKPKEKKKKKKKDEAHLDTEKEEFEVEDINNDREATSATESEADMCRKAQNDVEVETVKNSTPETIEKTKRKRHRKRRRKPRLEKVPESTPTMSSNSVAGDISSGPGKELAVSYQGREISKDETFVGCLPDKLEPPKYYRQGYRNRKTYEVQSSQHVKFTSDSESEDIMESTEQYNFMSKPKIKQEDGLDDSKSKTEDKNECISSGLVQNGFSPTNKRQNGFESPREILIKNEMDEGILEHKSFTATPYSYSKACTGPESNKQTRENSLDSCFSTPTERSGLAATPRSLERKTLFNGVSVFVRARRGGGFRELSKQEQLDTVATNVSTVFVNSLGQNMKSPSKEAPSPKHSVLTEQESCANMQQTGREHSHPKTMPETVSEESSVSDREDVPDKSLNSFSCIKEMSSLKTLSGVPKCGAVIAYKILEISADCTPGVSAYKIARVIGVDKNQMIELENLGDSAEVPRTRFHMEVEYEDEILTNVMSQEKVILHYSTLLEPKLISESQ